MKNNSIQRANLHGKVGNVVKETIVTDVRAADGIAVDWITGKLYWSDAWKQTIEVSDLRGQYRRVLIKSDIDMPRAIALHPNNGLV